MRWLNKVNSSKDRLLKILPMLILGAGIALRIIVYLQNRNLFIDEANVARNIYERGFLELLKPLDYEQYAPPLFLWIVKICTVCFGYSEYAFRLYPLIAGIVSLIFFYEILKKLVSPKIMWYALALMALAFIFVRYSSELKQYESDAMVTLFLILLNLKIDIVGTPARKFMLIWAIAGSISIWLSMSSVFILAGVGLSYLYTCVEQKKPNKVVSLVVVATLWIGQFLLYYLLVLKQQANSDYLQQYHAHYFIEKNVLKTKNLLSDLNLFSNLFSVTGGYNFLSLSFHIVLFITALVFLFARSMAKATLFFFPILFTFIASGFHQYAIVERLVLFLVPLVLILIALGFEKALQIRYRYLQVLIVLISLVCAFNHNSLIMAVKPYKFEQLTEELAFLKKNDVSGKDIYVHDGARPAFIYYTQVHPDRERWQRLKDANLLWWDADYNIVAENANGNAAFIYTSLSREELIEKKTIIERHLKLGKYSENFVSRCYVYIYSKP